MNKNKFKGNLKIDTTNKNLKIDISEITEEDKREHTAVEFVFLEAYIGEKV